MVFYIFLNMRQNSPGPAIKNGIDDYGAKHFGNPIALLSRKSLGGFK